MTGRLEGKVAVITGAGRGLGRAIALRFAREGARVVIAEIDAGNGAAVAREIGAGAIAVQCDVSSSADVARTFAAANEAFGPVDVLVNNAAVVGPAVTHFLEVDEALWDLVLDANLKGNFLCARRAADDMVAKGSGVIINLSSGGGSRSHRGMVTYDSAKGGVEAFTRSCALDLAPYGIRSCCIVPGMMLMDDDSPDSDRVAAVSATVPLGRPGTGDDIAGAAVFLASDDASYITGSCLYVEGGVLFQQRSPQVESFPIARYPKVGRLA